METTQSISSLIHGYRHTALLYVAAKLKLADELVSGWATASTLAAKMGVNADALHRVMRGLATMEVLEERAGGEFTLTALGQQLCSGAPGTHREMALLAGEEYMPAWGALLHTLQTGEPAFNHLFGMDAWQHRAQNPELGAAFNTSLRNQTSTISQSIQAAFDFSEVDTVLDIGGGFGGLLAQLLLSNAHLKGALLELPEVAAQADATLASPEIRDRFTALPGNFFTTIPHGFSLYMLKSVLHDWPDDACIQILQNCCAAMSGAARLLIIERVLPKLAVEDRDVTTLDLHMMAVLGGRERSAEEYGKLCETAGLRLANVTATTSGFQVMEFILADSAADLATST